MNCPPPSYSMWVFFCCCVRAFFWIGYRIIEFIGHLSFCKNISFFYEDSEEKWGLFFFSFFLWGYKKKEKYILPKKKEKKKERKKKWQLGFDLIRSLFVCHRFYRCVHTHFHVKLSTL